VIASHHFNGNPQPLEIQGVKQANRFLFDKLQATADWHERTVIFMDFMSVKFQLHHWEEQTTLAARNSIKNNYLFFLRCWMIDSNSISGAVLKHWVESRIGISPTYHKARIHDINSAAYFNYSVDVMQAAPAPAPSSHNLISCLNTVSLSCAENIPAKRQSPCTAAPTMSRSTTFWRIWATGSRLCG